MNDRPTPGSRYRRASYPVGADDTVPPLGMRSQGAAEPPSRRRSALQFLPLTLGTLAGILIAILAVSFLAQRSNSAPTVPAVPVDSTARALCTDLTQQRYDDLFALLTTSEQQIGPRDQFVASQRQLDAQLGAIKGCTYKLVSQDASSATLSLQLSRGALMATTAQVQLAMQDGSWRISNYDTSLV